LQGPLPVLICLLEKGVVQSGLVSALPSVDTSLLAVNICHRLTLAAATAQFFA
jgi:hypothetical protein